MVNFCQVREWRWVNSEPHTAVQKDNEIIIIENILSFGMCHLDIITSIQTTTEFLHFQIKSKNDI